MESINTMLYDFLTGLGVSDKLIYIVIGAIFGIALLFLCIIANWIAKRIILVILGRIVKKSRIKWDETLYEKKVFHKLSHLAPVMIIYWLGPVLMQGYPAVIAALYLISRIYVVLVLTLVIYAFLDAVGAIYSNFKIAKSRPIKSYLQVLKIIGGVVASIFILSIIIGQSPVYIFTGLGALTAVMMLVFKDSILGLVAGIQVSANDMVQIGDWIEMPKYGADGDVIDISLNTVRIQNFDRTITTIPSYALVSDSFKNWRGMVQAGGRRIMRDVYIDITSIKFCDKAMLERFASVRLLNGYLEKKQQEIDAYNREHEFDPAIPANGRRMTNIGTFRAYIKEYLLNHSGIHKELICMVRQMPPTEKGVPLQIYTFTNDTNWVAYEGIQGDIFDHILSVADFFELKIFQYPSEITIGSSKNG